MATADENKATEQHLPNYQTNEVAAEKSLKLKGSMGTYRMGQIYIPVWAGILGFMLSVLLLTCNCGPQNITYSDLSVDTKDNLGKMLQLRLENLSRVVAAQDSSSKEKKAWLDVAKKLLAKTKREQLELSDFNSDTALAYSARYISTNRKLLNEAITGNWKTTDTAKMVPFLIADTVHLEPDTVIQTRSQLLLKRTKFDHIADFFGKYPAIGFWYVFSIGQMTMWFLLIVLLGGNVLLLKSRLPEVDEKFFRLGSVLKFCTIPFVFVAAFTFLLYRLLIDNYIIADHYFLSSYNSRMILYAIPGYLSAIVCFGIYMWLSRMLDELNINHVAANRALQDNADLNKKYMQLKAFFDNTFLCSAIILSVFVIWIGILFTGINSMDAMKYYTLLSGKPFLSSDLVLLIGLIHTIILLLFYVPVTMRFNSLDIAKDASTVADPGNKKLFGSLFDSISTVLVTASPLIVGIVQHLINVVVNR